MPVIHLKDYHPNIGPNSEKIGGRDPLSVPDLNATINICHMITDLN